MTKFTSSLNLKENLNGTLSNNISVMVIFFWFFEKNEMGQKLPSVSRKGVEKVSKTVYMVFE